MRRNSPSGSRLWLRMAFVCCLVLPGCDGGSGSLNKVSGKVTVDGSPLTRGSVRFVPDTTKGNKSSAEPVGEIKPDGSYELTTNGKSGAPAGWYKVTVNATEQVDSSKPFSGKSLVPRKYNVPESTQLSVEVKASSKDGDYDLKVTSR